MRVMSWNRPTQNKTTTTTKVRRRFLSPARLTIATALILLVVVVSLIIKRTPKEAANQGSKRNDGLIKEVQPSRAKTNAAECVLMESATNDPAARPTRPGVKVNGYVMLPNGTLHKIKGDDKPLKPTKAPCCIFDHPAENIIATILTMQPGDTLVGTPNYNGKFTANFLKSLTVPIIPTSEDNDEVRELKKAVNEAKIELKAAYDRGEDIEALILESRKEFQDLAQYKADLRKEVLKYANREAPTDDDANDYLKAANMMLESRGIAPIDNIPLAKIKLKMKEKWEEPK